MLPRLHQIDSEILALEARRAELVCEREKLLAEERHPKTTATPLTPNAKIALFLSLFRCREDVYPRLWENVKTGMKGYSPVCRNEWFRGVCEKPRVKCSECAHQAFPPLDESAARDHLTGKSVIGTYAIRADNTCVFLVADFDGDGWREDIRAYRDAAREMGVEVAVERSRSGNGGHAWIFFNGPVPALVARRLGTLIVAKASALHPTMSLGSYDRFFPNQDTLPTGGFGNLIALPLQAKARESGNSAFLDEDFQLHLDQWHFLTQAPRMDRSVLDDLLEHTVPPASEGAASCFEDRVLDVIPTAVKKGDFMGSAHAVRRAQLKIPLTGLPASLTAALKRLATLANPVFSEKQRLRLGTYNIPRFIFCGEMHPDRLILPRGVVKAAGELFHRAGGDMEITDLRPSKGHCDLTFQGRLTPEQTAAVDAMLLHDDGVLLAPPGAGKTVMGCAVIAARKVPTLILVHRKTLLDQWQSRLAQFLGLEKKQVAMLAADGSHGGRPIVIGMIQTVSKSLDPGTLLESFAQVIIDECHHVPAASFVAVMKACPAHYFLGLTATPNRKDGLQKILFLQCGPVRHRMEPVADSTLERRLILRDIHLGLPPQEMQIPVHQLWDLLATHEARNRMIVTDIAKALADGRRCVVLSDRKEHLATLERLLNEAAPLEAKHIHRIVGTMGKKARAGVMAKISCLAEEGAGFVLLATSSLVGEGFDLPQLDTLFLTLPVSFKGRIIQYSGRLHRSCEGKSNVLIYDYSEADHPVTSHMLRKRMTAYRSMGYCIAEDAADAEVD
jgi:superfamily II DNA or RNA helicase